MMDGMDNHERVKLEIGRACPCEFPEIDVPISRIQAKLGSAYSTFTLAIHTMKNPIKHTFALFAALSLAAHAATPEQEKAFVESYKKAIEANDTKALAAFLFTEGAAKETVEFFTMMQTSNAGQKVSSIELVTPSKEESAEFGKAKVMPDGKKYKMPFVPTKQLVITIEEKSDSGSSKSTSKCAVGEKNGKLVIPVPVPAK